MTRQIKIKSKEAIRQWFIENGLPNAEIDNNCGLDTTSGPVTWNSIMWKYCGKWLEVEDSSNGAYNFIYSVPSEEWYFIDEWCDEVV